MRNTRLHVYPEGRTWTHATMWTTPRDLARIGQLMLQRGRRGGEQLVPEAWIEASVQPSQDLQSDYGLLWWLDVPGGFAARGAYETNLYVLPDRDLVVVRMQGGPREGAVPYEPAAFGLFEEIVKE
jgi:CubicO group peptidase (beta-lactamase class C family)